MVKREMLYFTDLELNVMIACLSAIDTENEAERAAAANVVRKLRDEDKRREEQRETA